MKRLKKIVSILLTAIMVLAMCVPVMAAEGSATPTTTYTITAPETSHQYEIYQIFTGKLKIESNGSKTLSDIKWGANGTGEIGTDVPEDVINALIRVKDGTDKEKLAVIKTYATLSKPVATIANGKTYTAPAGYYLIKDKNGSVSGSDVYTTYIVEVVGNVDITPKSDVPSFEKKVMDTNDSTGNTSGWQDSADYDIGDAVPFKLEGTVTSKYDDYEKYYFAFHDVEENGLSFNSDSVEVYVDGSKITSGYRLNTNLPSDGDGCSFEVIFDNLKDITAVHASSKITVTYTSTLNENAALGKQGNLNKAKLEFSNNPNEEQTGTEKPSTGETPWDNVIVFTYQVVVNKYANEVNDSNKLSGAEFTLTKALSDGSTKTIAVTKSSDGTSFTFKGLDDGTYTLTETTTPDGYNTIAPITFTVTADHTIEWTSGERTGILTSLTGNTTTGNITFNSDENKSQLSTDVINKSGSSLPETGGIGTTIFYVVGIVLMLGAGVLLITKRSMDAKH